MLDLNARSVLHAARAVVPAMLAKGAGKVINVGGQDFTVVGTVKKQKAGPFGSENQEDNDIFIPYYTFRKMFPATDDHFIIVRMREGQMKQGIDGIEQVLRRRRNVPLNEENNFEIGTPESFISTFDDIVRAVFGVMLIISSIAFMVGGVGVMADGDYGFDANVLDVEDDAEEAMALAATNGFAPPDTIRADRIALDGTTLRYSDASTASLKVSPASATPFAFIEIELKRAGPAGGRQYLG